MRKVIISLWAGLVVVLGIATGVAWFVANEGATTAGRPIAICGKTLYSGAVGLPVYSPYNDAASPHWEGPLSRVNHLLVGGQAPLLVQVSDDCGHGTRILIRPAGLVSVGQEIKASDGSAVALRLVGAHAGKATLVVQNGKYKGWKLALTVDG
jgi:hypothetical protein